VSKLTCNEPGSFRGMCCCNCKFKLELHKHPRNSGDLKGPTDETTGLSACTVMDSLDNNYKADITDRSHGSCEMYSGRDTISSNDISLGMKVTHKSIYKGEEVMEVTGIKTDKGIVEVRLEGDYSGGTNPVIGQGSEWLPFSGINKIVG